ncbi:hypothetical protein GGS23DRAFT_383694 [Durotheca rogersii]|uniref:uncharacterized protein n=1 Tax=Durotheca rogersii TaxID=419775 RepID=UPI00221EE13F|nr:uncharacterized protein GGS23DRAFT_383694 [Durotheca rogersii]KAI5866356.1 hypothetical protein GGS23DRAFT_383694 [Durotheca rogersii]
MRRTYLLIPSPIPPVLLLLPKVCLYAHREARGLLISLRCPSLSVRLGASLSLSLSASSSRAADRWLCYRHRTCTLGTCPHIR